MTNSKKNIVLNSDKKNGKKKIWWISSAALVMLGLSVVLLLNLKGPASVKSAEAPGDTEGTISFPLSDFSDGQAKYYAFDYQGKEMSFFILQSSDGVVRAAFNACDVCYQARKGYRQVGDFMVCNNCGQRFASVRINEEKGGCNPSPLERTITEDRIIISEADLAKGAFYF